MESGRARRLAVPGIVAAIVATTSVAGPGTAAGVREQPAERFGYTCQFPAGPWPVGVRVTAAYPAGGTVADPISVTDAVLEVILPAAALPATTVAAIPVLDTTITQHDTVETAPWQGLVSPSTPVPAEGEMVLTSSATVPPVTVGAAGDVTFAVAGLTITFTGTTADGAAIDPLPVTCTLDEGQNPLLATVPVADDPSRPPATRTPLPPGGIQIGPGGSERGGPVQAFAPVPPPPNCKEIDDGVEPYPTKGCSFIAGYSNVARLGASVLQPNGIINIAATRIHPVLDSCPDDNTKICQRAIIEPNLDGRPVLPPVDGSFVTFDFVPTAAKLELTQIGFARVNLRFSKRLPFTGTVNGNVRYDARIYDATVNGVPLDVGPDCRTELDIALSGTYPEYRLEVGGILHGRFAIPAFEGCGVIEDLDPLLTGTISGPDNYAKLTQARLCTWNSGQGCPPVHADPQR